MKNSTVGGVAAALFVALAIGLAAPAVGEPGDGTIISPPGGPVEIYPEVFTGATNPNTPFGPDPYLPYSVGSH